MLPPQPDDETSANKQDDDDKKDELEEEEVEHPQKRARTRQAPTRTPAPVRQLQPRGRPQKGEVHPSQKFAQREAAKRGMQR